MILASGQEEMRDHVTPKLTVSGWMELETALLPDQRICAIGDVHGMSANLAALLEFFDRCPEGIRDNILVCLGDLVDRGPDSIGAVDMVMATPSRAFTRVVPLMGNHEQMMRLALAGDESYHWECWLMNGAISTMRNVADIEALMKGQQGIAAGLADALGPDRMDWLRSLHPHVTIGNLLFVHAGIRNGAPVDWFLGKPWDRLEDDHWAWIREGFLDSPVEVPDLVVVHGHTPVHRSPVERLDEERDLALHMPHDGKINLDGGSALSGCVTGAEFTAGRWRLATAVTGPG